MVQPAVDLRTVTRGKYTWRYVVKWPTPTPTPYSWGGSGYAYDADPYGLIVHGPEEFTGPHFDSLKFATKVFATMSDRDNVLTQFFRMHNVDDSDGVGEKRSSPDVKEALGSLKRSEFVNTLKSLEYPPNFEALDFASDSEFPAINDHGQIFQDHGQAVVDALCDKILREYISP